jgi:hypothetical protein
VLTVIVAVGVGYAIAVLIYQWWAAGARLLDPDGFQVTVDAPGRFATETVEVPRSVPATLALAHEALFAVGCVEVAQGDHAVSGQFGTAWSSLARHTRYQCAATVTGGPTASSVAIFVRSQVVGGRRVQRRSAALARELAAELQPEE